MSEENQYSVYMLFCKEPKTETQIYSLLDNEDYVLHTRKADEEGKRFVCLLKKNYFDYLIQKDNFGRDLEFNLTKFRVDQKPLEKGTTYGFFIKFRNEEERKSIVSLFQKFEDYNFLRKNSYEIINPKPYPDGKKRNYLAVSFEKKEDRFPKFYIKKLKSLINNSSFDDGYRLRVNWISNTVLRDMKDNNKNKERKIKSSNQ